MSASRICVGIDLSEPPDVIVEQAMSSARRWGAKVVLLYVGPATATARRTLEELRQRLAGQGVEISHAIVEGTPEFEIPNRAHELACGLIVVGTHGRTGLARLADGSVAERVARLAECPVLVARGAPQAAEGGFHRIIVGTDYSPLADVAIAQALELAAPDARVHLIHAWSVPAAVAPESLFAVGDAYARVAKDAIERGAEALARWRQARPDLPIELEMLEAAAQEALVDRARALDADLIAVGSHGRRGWRRLVLGSVSELIVRRAPCSVLVARAEQAS